MDEMILVSCEGARLSLPFPAHHSHSPPPLRTQSEPYDLSTLSVPKYSHPLLQRLASGDESVTPADLPAGEDLSRAKAKARSWERVGKVLEGERKRAAARRAVKGGGL